MFTAHQVLERRGAATPLLARIAELGGVRTMFLTHRDDVADHARVRARFACERVMHEADVTGDTAEAERMPAGSEPVALDEELLAIPIPGHTRGSLVLLYRERFLFTGDHLWGAEDELQLDASPSVAWYSWPEQKRSLEATLLSLRVGAARPRTPLRTAASPGDAARAGTARPASALSIAVMTAPAILAVTVGTASSAFASWARTSRSGC